MKTRVVISLARMNRIIEIDTRDALRPGVEPGVLNLDISVAANRFGLHYAPDPSSQAACSIGGNVATNSGGPHCLAYGVTAQHILGMELVTRNRRGAGVGRNRAGPRPAMTFAGSQSAARGTLGIVTKVCARLTAQPNRPSQPCCSTSTRSRPVPKPLARSSPPESFRPAMEMMDQRMIEAVEQFVGAGASG